MKTQIVTIIVLIMLVGGLVGMGHQLGYAQGTNRFSINGADGIFTFGLTDEKSGWNLARHVSQWFADGSVAFPLLQPSQLTRTVKHHVSRWFADGSTAFQLMQPTQMTRSINQHVSQWFADGTRSLEVIYPAAMVNDQIPPTIANFGTNSGGNGSTVLFRWTTNEPATSEIQLGTQEGALTIKQTNLLYRLHHTFAVPDLAVGQNYFYQLTSVDRSGQMQINSGAVLVEEQADSLIYLPLVSR